MIDVKWIEKDIEERDRCLIRVLFRNFPGGTQENEENPVRIAYISAWIRADNLQNTNLEGYLHTAIICHPYKISLRQ
jgi:hypothetical protein